MMPRAGGAHLPLHFATHKPGDPQWRRRGAGGIAIDLPAERAPENLVLAGWDEVDCIALIGSAPASRSPVFLGLRWEEQAAPRA
jgi:hypothetical protein